MTRDDRARRVELAVNVSERAEGDAGSEDPAYVDPVYVDPACVGPVGAAYFVACAGTSRSVLSQMKSLLL